MTKPAKIFHLLVVSLVFIYFNFFKIYSPEGVFQALGRRLDVHYQYSIFQGTTETQLTLSPVQSTAEICPSRNPEQAAPTSLLLEVSGSTHQP